MLMNELLQERFIRLLSARTQVTNEEMETAYECFMEQIRFVGQSENTYSDIYRTLNITRIELESVFILNKDNKVKSLTVEQIQQIYTAELTNWSQVGGNNSDINVFTRPRNSGSEEIFRTLVMNGLKSADFHESPISAMAQVFNEVIYDVNAICYTFNNYKDIQARVPDSKVPKIAINNIFPNKKSIQNRTYPFISEVYVAIRSDLDRSSMAYRLHEWLQSENAKSTIAEY
jgi:ABC-type phosphate transport system, periplasmic component